MHQLRVFQLFRKVMRTNLTAATPRHAHANVGPCPTLNQGHGGGGGSPSALSENEAATSGTSAALYVCNKGVFGWAQERRLFEVRFMKFHAIREAIFSAFKYCNYNTVLLLPKYRKIQCTLYFTKGPALALQEPRPVR